MKTRSPAARWFAIALIGLLLVLGFATLGERLGVRAVVGTMTDGAPLEQPGLRLKHAAGERDRDRTAFGKRGSV